MIYIPIEAPLPEHISRRPRYCDMISNRKIRRGFFDPFLTLLNLHITHQPWRMGGRRITSGVGENRHPIYRQSKQRATSGAEKYPSIVHLTSDNVQLLISCSSNNTRTGRIIERGEEVVRLKK